MMLHTCIPTNPTKYKLLNTLRFLRYSSDKILRVNVTMVRSKVKSHISSCIDEFQYNEMSSVPIYFK